jgi:D-sedoheptulose 7-phosphate isomerase
MIFSDYFDRICVAIRGADTNLLELAADLINRVPPQGKKVILAGNGASAAIASHVSVDLTKTAGVRAVTFNDDDLITCFANDYGYAHWVEKALEHYADPGDVAILISSSGMSPNIVNAASKAKAMGLSVITLSGFDRENRLTKLGDLNFWIDSKEYNIVETVHQTWLLALVDKLAFLNRKSGKA